MHKLKRLIACLALVLGLGTAGVITSAIPASATPYVWVSWYPQYYQDGTLQGVEFYFHDTSTPGYYQATRLKRGKIQCSNGTYQYTNWYYTGGIKTLLCPSGYHTQNIWVESSG